MHPKAGALGRGEVSLSFFWLYLLYFGCLCYCMHPKAGALGREETGALGRGELVYHFFGYMCFILDVWVSVCIPKLELWDERALGRGKAGALGRGKAGALGRGEWHLGGGLLSISF